MNDSALRRTMSSRTTCSMGNSSVTLDAVAAPPSLPSTTSPTRIKVYSKPDACRPVSDNTIDSSRNSKANERRDKTTPGSCHENECPTSRGLIRSLKNLSHFCIAAKMQSHCKLLTLPFRPLSAYICALPFPAIAFAQTDISNMTRGETGKKIATSVPRAKPILFVLPTGNVQCLNYCTGRM